MAAVYVGQAVQAVVAKWRLAAVVTDGTGAAFALRDKHLAHQEDIQRDIQKNMADYGLVVDLCVVREDFVDMRDCRLYFNCRRVRPDSSVTYCVFGHAPL